jgi:hypothetical protein
MVTDTIAGGVIGALSGLEASIDTIPEQSQSLFDRFCNDVAPRLINRFKTNDIQYVFERRQQTDNPLSPYDLSRENHPREAVVLAPSSGNEANRDGTSETYLTVYIANNDFGVVPNDTDLVLIEGKEHNIKSVRAVPARGPVCLWVLSVETSR